jgi:aminopeptidase-like protein
MNQIKEKNTDTLSGIKLDDGREFVPKLKDKLLEGEYEVFIDSEYKPGIMKLGVHTIKGESDREILLFAHLDHPFQANDNLSGVACLVDLATKLKSKYTIKIVLCPETIGSIGYALTQDISKVEFMMAVDICGNDGMILMQKSFKDSKINNIAHLAIHAIGQSYQKGAFRNTIGSDEYVFNDPLIDVPGIMLSRYPYAEYHTSEDTADKINYTKIEEMQKVILNIIDYWEKDYVPVKNFKGPLMRSKYGIQTPNPQVNLSWDYLMYSIDGVKSLSQLCCDYGLNFNFVYSIFEKMKENEDIRINVGKRKLKKTTK